MCFKVGDRGSSWTSGLWFRVIARCVCICVCVCVCVHVCLCDNPAHINKWNKRCKSCSHDNAHQEFVRTLSSDLWHHFPPCWWVLSPRSHACYSWGCTVYLSLPCTCSVQWMLSIQPEVNYVYIHYRSYVNVPIDRVSMEPCVSGSILTNST